MVDYSDRNCRIECVFPYWKLQRVANEGLEVLISVSADLSEIETPIGSYRANILFVNREIFSIAAANI